MENARVLMTVFELQHFTILDLCTMSVDCCWPFTVEDCESVRFTTQLCQSKAWRLSKVWWHLIVIATLTVSTFLYMIVRYTLQFYPTWKKQSITPWGIHTNCWGIHTNWSCTPIIPITQILSLSWHSWSGQANKFCDTTFKSWWPLFIRAHNSWIVNRAEITNRISFYLWDCFIRYSIQHRLCIDMTGCLINAERCDIKKFLHDSLLHFSS